MFLYYDLGYTHFRDEETKAPKGKQLLPVKTVGRQRSGTCVFSLQF